MADATMTREAFQQAIEKGIRSLAAPTADEVRGAKAALRKVGREGKSFTYASFVNCPMTQAGLFGLQSTVVGFWLDFDQAIEEHFNPDNSHNALNIRDVEVVG